MTAVYFDVDGTLAAFDRPFEDLFADGCRAAGVELPDGAYETYSERLFSHFEAFADDPYRAAMEDCCATLELDADAVTLAEAVVAAELDATVPARGVTETLDALAADGHRLGALTNGYGPVQRGKLDRLELADRFETVVISHELGAAKPDPRAFAIARERLDDDDYVYVGDSHDHDVVPAAAAGFRTVHIAADGVEPSPAADLVVGPDDLDRVVEFV